MRRFVPFLLLLALLAAGCGGGSDDTGDGASASFAAGRDVYRDSCAVCHGQDGQGGVGNPLDEVATTFPDCEDQVRWITMGSSKWRDDVAPTYGTQEREIQGSMPGFDGVRSEAEIRLAAAYQRVAFGGETEADAIAACGVPAG